MKSTHKKIADVYLKQPKKSMTAAIKTVQPELTPKSASVKAARMLKNDSVLEYLQSKGLVAAKRINKLARIAKNEGVQLQANKDILDRAGYAPKQVKEVTHKTEDVADKKARLELLERALKSGNEIELQRIVLKAPQ